MKFRKVGSASVPTTFKGTRWPEFGRGGPPYRHRRRPRRRPRTRPRPYKILIYEDEYEDEDEKNPIRSHSYALRLFLFSTFPPGCRHRPLRAGGRIPDTLNHLP